MKLFAKITLSMLLTINPLNLYSQETSTMEWSEFSFMLKPSTLGGVGVFAVHDIPAGTPLFRTDHRSRTFQTKDVDPEFVKFCIFIDDETCRGPERFDRMEIGWYVNHSATPNVAKQEADQNLTLFERKKYDLYTTKDIKAGDEIVIDYNYLNEPEHLKEDYYRQSTTTTATVNQPAQQIPAQNKIDKEWTEFSFMLKPSSLGGIGVFAVHNIPANTQVFRNDHTLRTFKTKDLDPALQQYCIHLNDEECVGPERFDRMEIGWYLNHSSKPNIAKNHEDRNQSFFERQKYAFCTIKDIKAGDEILIDYNYLNEPEHLKEDYYRTTDK